MLAGQRTVSVDWLPISKLVLSFGALFILQCRRQAHRVASMRVIVLFCFPCSTPSAIWSEKCGTTFLRILKIILPVFLWFHFSPEESIKPFPSRLWRPFIPLTLMSVSHAIVAYLHFAQVLFKHFTTFFS